MLTLLLLNVRPLLTLSLSATIGTDGSFLLFCFFPQSPATKPPPSNLYPTHYHTAVTNVGLHICRNSLFFHHIHTKYEMCMKTNAFILHDLKQLVPVFSESGILHFIRRGLVSVTWQRWV